MDDVAFADGGDGAADGCFGRDVTGHEAARGSGEATVGEEGHGLAQFGDAGDGGRDLQHLAHAGSAFRTFVADDDHVVGLDLAALDGVEGVLLGVEDARRAAMLEALVSGDLDDAAFGSEIALEDDESAGGLDGVVEGVDDFLSGSLDGLRGFFGEGLAGNVPGGAVDQAGVDQALCEQAAAARGVIIGRDVLAPGLEVAEQRRLRADAVEVVDRERDAHLVGDGEEVKHGICRSAGGRDAGDGVLDGLRGDDLAGEQVVLGELEDHAAGFAGGVELFGQECRHAGEADGRDAEEFAGHGHGVGGELAAACAGAGTGRGFDGFEAGVVESCRRRASRWLRRHPGW